MQPFEPCHSGVCAKRPVWHITGTATDGPIDTRLCQEHTSALNVSPPTGFEITSITWIGTDEQLTTRAQAIRDDFIPKPDLPPASPLDDPTFAALSKAMEAVSDAMTAVSDVGFPRDGDVLNLLESAWGILCDVESDALPGYSAAQEAAMHAAIRALPPVEYDS